MPSREREKGAQAHSKNIFSRHIYVYKKHTQPLRHTVLYKSNLRQFESKSPRARIRGSVLIARPPYIIPEKSGESRKAAQSVPRSRQEMGPRYSFSIVSQGRFSINTNAMLISLLTSGVCTCKTWNEFFFFFFCGVLYFSVAFSRRVLCWLFCARSAIKSFFFSTLRDSFSSMCFCMI